MKSLNKQEKERYDRHLRIHNFEEAQQLELCNAKVLVIGAGGLGCPVIQYLTAAGVGHIGIVDPDVVALSNLQRQILYSENEVGIQKAELAAAKMKELNSGIKLQVYAEWLDAKLADELFPTYDLVVGATDNYKSRYLIDEKSIAWGIPFVHGAIYEFEGQLSVFNYKGGPSYADIFGEEPPAPDSPPGVVGAIPGLIGSMMALEVIKILCNRGEVMSGKLFLCHTLQNSFRVIPCV